MVQKSSHPMLHYRQADAEYSHIFGVHGTTRRYLLCKSPVTAVHTVHCTCHYPPPSHLPLQLHICIFQAVCTYNVHTGIDGSENALPWTHSMHDAVQNFRTLEIVWQVWLDNYICFVEIFVYIPPVQYKLTCLAHSWTYIFFRCRIRTRDDDCFCKFGKNRYKFATTSLCKHRAENWFWWCQRW